MSTPRIDAGYAYLVPVILLWGWNPLLVSHLSTKLPILEVDLLATLFALAAMAVAIGFRRGWGAFRGHGHRDFRRMILVGATGIFPYTLLYYLAFSLAPASSGEVNIINYLWPILTLLLSGLILREPLSLRGVLALALSFAGVCLLISEGRLFNLQASNLPAYAAAGLGAGFWALFSVLTKRFSFDPLVSMFVYDATAVVLFAIVAVLFAPLRLPSLSDMALLAALGAGLNGLGYLMWILALRSGNTARMTGGVYLVPFIALAYLALFRQETIRLVQVLSLLLILSGPLLLRHDRRRMEGAAPTNRGQ